jgi:hypothetical protein
MTAGIETFLMLRIAKTEVSTQTGYRLQAMSAMIGNAGSVTGVGGLKMLFAFSFTQMLALFAMRTHGIATGSTCCIQCCWRGRWFGDQWQFIDKRRQLFWF